MAGDTSHDTLWKSLSIVIISIISLSCAHIPIMWERCRSQQHLLSVANAFAAGVFITMALVHLLPEASEDMGNAGEGAEGKRYRIVYIMCILGYSMILTVQRILFPEGHLHDEDEEEASLPQIPAHVSPASMDEQPIVQNHQANALRRDSPPAQFSMAQGGRATPPTQFENTVALPKKSGTFRNYGCADEDKFGGLATRRRVISLSGDLDSRSIASAAFSVRTFAAPGAPRRCWRHHPPNGTRLTDLFVLASSRALQNSVVPPPGLLPPNTPASPSAPITPSFVEPHAPEAPLNDAMLLSPKSSVAPVTGRNRLASIILMVALTLHGFFAGVVLGLQKGNREIFLIFVAIVSHKWAESLSLGISLARSALKLKVQQYLVVAFSAGTPIGIGAGWVAQKALPDSATAYFMALSSGTFLYIGASEVVAEEFAHSEHRFWKLAAYLMGCGAIYLSTSLLDFD